MPTVKERWNTYWRDRRARAALTETIRECRPAIRTEVESGNHLEIARGWGVSPTEYYAIVDQTLAESPCARNRFLKTWNGNIPRHALKRNILAVVQQKSLERRRHGR